MIVERSRLLERAENARRESRYLDFKAEFDVTSNGAWCEAIKDIVEFANSGGGVIVFGVSNDGSVSGADLTQVKGLDLAMLTDKIRSYTGFQFSDIELAEIKRNDQEIVGLFIDATDVPMVFIRPGTYDAGSGKQKSAFTQGAIYFRHGAKSEPGNRDDLVSWRDRAMEKIRKDWLGGIRKVVESPAGHAISVVSSPVSSKSGAPRLEGMSIRAKVTADPGAVRFVPENAEEIWPHRQKDLLREINKEIKKSPPINGHDILCINTRLDVLKKHPEFAYKPHKLASPQYSDEYVKWIVVQYRQDQKFFDRAREEYKLRSY